MKWLRIKSHHSVLTLHYTTLTECPLSVLLGEKPAVMTSTLTLIHVSGEAGQDTTQRCCIKKVHGAEEDTAEQLVVEHRCSLHRALSTEKTAVFEQEA